MKARKKGIVWWPKRIVCCQRKVDFGVTRGTTLKGLPGWDHAKGGSSREGLGTLRCPCAEWRCVKRHASGVLPAADGAPRSAGGASRSRAQAASAHVENHSVGYRELSMSVRTRVPIHGGVRSHPAKSNQCSQLSMHSEMKTCVCALATRLRALLGALACKHSTSSSKTKFGPALLPSDHTRNTRSLAHGQGWHMPAEQVPCKTSPPDS